MDAHDPPDDEKAQQIETGLATSRSRRERNPRAAKTGRFSALEKLKAQRESGKKHLSDVGDVQNVYDVVDVDQYSEMVTNRVNDDWIVDDDGSYVEDGREIFDDEMGDEPEGHRSHSEKMKGPKAKKREKEKNVNKTSEDSSSSTAGKSNIKNMFLKMGKDGNSTKRKRDTDAPSTIDQDQVLEELLGKVKSNRSAEKSGINPFKTPESANITHHSATASHNNK
jgi:DNA polymerase alpha subunit A